MKSPGMGQRYVTPLKYATDEERRKARLLQSRHHAAEQARARKAKPSRWICYCVGEGGVVNVEPQCSKCGVIPTWARDVA